MAATVVRRLSALLRPLSRWVRTSPPQVRQLSGFLHPQPLPSACAAVRLAAAQTFRPSLLQRVSALSPSLSLQPCRNLTYVSLKKGKRKTVNSVTARFMRLHCGLWIRRKAGYKKKLWRKQPARRKRLREIVFCNKTQSKLLDKMTTSFWKRRNWFLNDPYLKYHDRVNL